MILGAVTIKEASYCPMPILGLQSCEVENGPLRAETLLAVCLVTDDFLSESKQHLYLPYHN